MFEESFSYSAVNEGATGSEKEALHNPEGCESGMNVHGLLLCCSSSFHRLVVTEEKKWGQNSVKFILSYSLMAWQKRRGYERRAERKGKEKRNESDKGISLCSLQIPLFCQSGELDLLKKPNAKVAKNGLNSSDEEEISVET